MKRQTATPILIIPGIGGSGPDHWQTIWQKVHPECQRVMQREWDQPIRDEWCTKLDDAVSACHSPPLLLAHSLGCLLVVHWARRSRRLIVGAVLVAAPDPKGVRFPQEAAGFSPLPHGPLPFPSALVASTDDVYSGVEFARQAAAEWGSEFIEVGAAGHLNAESGLGRWEDGWRLVQRLLRRWGGSESGT